MPSKINDISFLDSVMLIYMQNMNFAPPFFLEKLPRYNNLVILGTMDTPGHAQQKQYH